MSGTADPVSAPTDNAEWARLTDQRLSSLENPGSVRVGPWVLSASADGNLIGSYADGGSVVLAKKPAGGETDPDAIEEPVNSMVSVTLSGTQSIPAGGSGTAVIFDSVAVEVGGDWTGGLRNFNSVVVPQAGAYMITGYCFFAAGTARYATAITVDGIPRIAGKTPQSGTSAIDCSSAAVGGLVLNAGQAVGMLAHCSSATNIEASTTPWSTPVPCMMTLALVTPLE